MLELIAFGLSNKEIARRLSLGRRTVETHIDHVLRKLDVPTRARAVSEAVRSGLLASALTSAPTGSNDTRLNNLPFQLTTLLGREQDIADLKSSLEANRLVTLSGSGGVGKTRVALRVGVDLLDSYPEGVWFCDFSPISNAELVASAVAKVLGVHQHQNRSLADSIVHALRRKHALLIFDNCEHVRDAVATLADEILHNCPNIRILATSRQSLGIIGEIVHRLPSLAVPETTDNLRIDQTMRYAAIALFLDRVQISNSRFTLTNDSAPIVAEICRRLDGIPLAIELAATRVNAISVQTLARSLDDRFNVLTAGNRTSLPRHKTLLALIDWSYDLLTAQEQQLFKRMGIFAGVFSLDAALGVCGGEDVNANNILDLLSSLTDKSLVVADTGGEIERYRLLESTRAYALDKLAAVGERERLARRHGAYFCDRAQEADKSYGMGSTAAWLAGLELDNYRAVLEWALKDGHDIALGGTVSGALGRLWSSGGLAVEGRYWIGLAQAGLDESANPQVAARLWLALAQLSETKRRQDSAERALALYESVSDGRGSAWALYDLGFSHLQMGRLEEASTVNTRALTAMRECGDKWGVAVCLDQLASTQWYRGDVTGGRELFAQALEAYKALGAENGLAVGLTNLAELEFADGQVEQALSLAVEALEIHARGKNAASLATGHNNSAAYRIAFGDVNGARTAAGEGLRWARQAEYPLLVTNALQHLTLIVALDRDFHRAARLIGYINLQCKELGLERESTEKWTFDKLMATLRERLSEAEIEKLAAEGAEWSEDRAFEEALRT